MKTAVQELDLFQKHHSELDASATGKIPNKEVKAKSFLHGLLPWEEEASKCYHHFNWITLEPKSILGLSANLDRTNTLGLIFGKSAELGKSER